MGDEPGMDDGIRVFAGEVEREKFREETAGICWKGCGEVDRDVRGGSWVEEGVLDTTEEREGVWE